MWVVKWIIRYKLVFTDAEGTSAALCVCVKADHLYTGSKLSDAQMLLLWGVLLPELSTLL